MVTLKIKVIPNASRAQISGWIGDELKVKVPTQPEKGKANKAVIQLIARALNLNTKDVSITSGTTSPHKILEIDNISNDELLDRLI